MNGRVHAESRKHSAVAHFQSGTPLRADTIRRGAQRLGNRLLVCDRLQQVAALPDFLPDRLPQGDDAACVPLDVARPLLLVILQRLYLSEQVRSAFTGRYFRAVDVRSASDYTSRSFRAVDVDAPCATHLRI
jgi:hypothetical protein